MRRIFAVVTLIVLAVATAMAQTGSDWNAVMQLEPGTRVRIALANGQIGESRLRLIDEKQIGIGSRRAPTIIPRTEILSLARQQGTHAGKRAKVGFTVGAVLGSLLIINAPAAAALMQSSIWGAFGAGMGFVDGLSDPRFVVIYEPQVPTF